MLWGLYFGKRHKEEGLKLFPNPSSEVIHHQAAAGRGRLVRGVLCEWGQIPGLIVFFLVISANFSKDQYVPQDECLAENQIQPVRQSGQGPVDLEVSPPGVSSL